MFFPRSLFCTCLLLGLLPSSALPAPANRDDEAMTVFRFDSPSALKPWVVGYNPLKAEGIKLSRKFATESGYSLELRAPAWTPNAPEWPLWQTVASFPGDWRPYDRLLIDLANPTNAVELVGLKTVDTPTSKLPSGQWGGVKVTVQPRSHLRAVFSIDDLMKGILVKRMDQGDIHTFLLYATRPASDFHLHVADVVLLKAGDPLPPLPDRYVGEIKDLRLRPAFAEAQKALEETSGATKKIASEAVRNWAKERLETLRAEWTALDARGRSAATTLDSLDDLSDSAARLTRAAHRLPSLAALREAAAARKAAYVVAWAGSTEKVIPREMPLDGLRMEDRPTLAVARNESESLQLAVVPFDTALQNVRVEAGPFRTAKGESLPAEAVDIRTVGYVNTRPAPYETAYAGWWPDPLLDFLPSVSIAPEDAQTFWLRVRPGKEQAAGIYEGEVRVTPENAPPTVRKLAIRVYDFTLPDQPPMPIAMPSGNEDFFKPFSSESWETLKFKVADFQADYYIGWNNLYVPHGPDWEVLEHLKKQGRLGPFNLYPLGFGGGAARVALKAIASHASDDDYHARMEKLIAQIRPVYEEAKKRGLLGQAYFYGMDEVPAPYFSAVKRISDDIREAFPEVPIMTTAMDHTFGKASQAEAIDIWVPILHEYEPEKAKEARARGKKVWWYNCKTPAHPYPNQFTEYPAIELRLLHGAMAAKYRPDGFLYYSFFRRWQLKGTPPRHALDKGPYTDWDPCALAFSESEIYNGEGYLAYPGPNGRPLASVRLENFRDGLEDLAYWKKLHEQAGRLRGEGSLSSRAKQWLVQADAALEVPETVVKSSHEYTHDASLLLAWRDRIANLIEQFPQLPTP